MHPSALLLIVLVAANAACTAAGTPAVQFWEETLPGTPMPLTIAELVQKGTDHSPLKERSVPQLHQPDCLGYTYEIKCGGPPPSSEAMVATGVFFQQDKVRVGSVMTAYFPPVDLPAILPRNEAERAPFDNVRDVLAMFAIAPGSAEESIVRGTVSGCQAPPLTANEWKACATSLEGTLQVAARMLGTKRMSVAASALTPREGLPRQEYEVVAVAPLDGRRHVTCHDDPFPYAVYRCHMEKDMSTTEAYVLTLRGLQHGSDAPSFVDMVAVCHLDTSNWSPAHPAFEMLNLRPGGAPVCHFMPYADLLFSDKAANA